MFFSDWYSLFRIVVMTVMSYAGLIVVLRLTGNRTLSKMNSFDFIVTIALGSTLATVILNKSITLAEGLLALSMLVLLQFVVTWLSARFSRIDRLVKTPPTLVFAHGAFLHDQMKRVRLAEGEIRAAIREQGRGAIEDVAAVILESDGQLTVIPEFQAERRSALEDVR